MTREEINEMIERQGVYEIVYRDELGERVYHISDIKARYDNNSITAYCHETDYEIDHERFFSIEEILSAKRYWIDILEEDEVAPKSGVYLFACRGDNHLIAELFRLEQGDKLYKYFEEDYYHSNGHVRVIPLAYHLVEEFVSGNLESCLSAVPKMLEYEQRGITRIIAFKQDRPLEILSYVANGENGVQYLLRDTHDFFDDMNGPGIPFNPQGDEKTEVLGLYSAISYSITNVKVHWSLCKKAHPKTEDKQ